MIGFRVLKKTSRHPIFIALEATSLSVLSELRFLRNDEFSLVTAKLTKTKA